MNRFRGEPLALPTIARAKLEMRWKRRLERTMKGHMKHPCGQCGALIVAVPTDIKDRLKRSASGKIFCGRPCFARFSSEEQERKRSVRNKDKAP